MRNLAKILIDSKRWTNPATYIAILATLPAIFAMFHVSFLASEWSSIEFTVKAFLTTLMELGVLMNPTTTGFSDTQGGK
jgi:uncharacterized membrane protein